MNRNLLLAVAALFAIGASGATAAQVDFRPVQTEKLEKSNKVELKPSQAGSWRSPRCAAIASRKPTRSSVT